MINFSVSVQYLKLTVLGKTNIQNRQNKKIIEEIIPVAEKIVIINETIDLCQQNTTM